MTHGGIITGTITCQKTGTTSDIQHYLFRNDASMKSIVRVIHAEVYKHEDDFEPFQISVDTLALDAIGSVFELNLEFRKESREAAEAILNDMQPNGLYSVSGDYTYADGTIWALQNPEYLAIQAEEKDELYRVFQDNYQKQAKDLTCLTLDHAGEMIYSVATAISAMLSDDTMTALKRDDLQRIFAASNGRLSFGSARASGGNRITAAIEAAFARCFPEIKDFLSATVVAVNIIGSPDLMMEEYENCVRMIMERFRDDVQVAIGVAISEALTDTIEITILVGG
jgi:FtsZ family, C-terminal domain